MSIGEEAHFENSWKGTLKVLRELSVFYFLLIACLIYVLVKEDYEMLKIGAWLLVPVFVVPHLILHIWYYFVDRSVSIDIYYWQNHLIYRKERKEEKICFDEIDHIVKYVSWHGRGVYGQLPHNFYNYTAINLKNGRKLIVTNLTAEDLGLGFREKKYRYLNPPIG